MSQREVAITGGPNNTKALVTGQQELLVKVNSAATSGLATEATLLDVETAVQQVETNTTGVARTPGIIRPTIAGDVNSAAATFYSVSVANVGLANGTVLGAVIKPGEVLNFSADALNNYFTSFDYDATGTEFVIIFVS